MRVREAWRFLGGAAVGVYNTLQSLGLLAGGALVYLEPGLFLGKLHDLPFRG
jgi:hypothetical protein